MSLCWSLSIIDDPPISTASVVRKNPSLVSIELYVVETDVRPLCPGAEMAGQDHDQQDDCADSKPTFRWAAMRLDAERYVGLFLIFG